MLILGLQHISFESVAGSIMEACYILIFVQRNPDLYND